VCRYWIRRPSPPREARIKAALSRRVPPTPHGDLRGAVTIDYTENGEFTVANKEMRYTACLIRDGTPGHSSYDAPPDWSPSQIHQALKDKGFRPSTGVPVPSVRVSLLQVPPVTLLRTGREKIEYVSSLGPGPSEYFLPGADRAQTAAVLQELGFAFAYEGRLVET
jgi:hypothetical protein